MTFRLSLGSTPDPAKGSEYQEHPEDLVVPPWHFAAIGYLYGVRSALPPGRFILTRKGWEFNLGSRESGCCERITESKCTAKIKHRGPGAARCVLGHQPRCVSAIRLRSPFVLAPNARGQPWLRIRGSSSS